MLTVETPLGILRATESFYCGHPGIWVELQKPGEKDYEPLALVEYGNADFGRTDNEETMITRVWRDIDKDEPSDCIVHENVGNS